MAEQRYKVIERIDAGGMAEVFKANSTSMQGFEKLVAIKRILPSLTQNERFVRMFLDEAKVSLHLNHTNCVHVFDLGIADGTYFIVMEFVDGTNLKKLIEFLHHHKQPMSVEDAVFIAIEVCKGLTHAHEKKDQSGNPLDIVHRDISPPNVLLSKAGEVKITDFGLAKAKSQAEITDPGVVKGKFGYLSPEAAHGEDVDGRTDIFAVGILLWEMLAGRRLFLGESDYDTLQLVRKAEIPSIRGLRNDVPRPLEKLLQRTLARDVDKRFQTAHDLAQALARFLFEYGRVVTSYDIAELVNQLIDKRPKRAKTKTDEVIGATIQQQLDQLKSLEEIDDLDMYMAQHYDSLPDEGEVAADADGDFEDPRMWADLGFGGGAPDDAPKNTAPRQSDSSSSGEHSGSWEEAGLDDLARSTSAYKAIDPETLDAKPQASSPAPRRSGPPTMPGGAMKAPAPKAGPSAQATADNRGAPKKQSPASPAAPQKRRAQPSPAAADPKAEPRRQPAQTPASTADQSGADDTGLSPMLITLLVALGVVIVGAAAVFALGWIPPG